MTVRKGAKKIAKKILALVLCLSILLCGVPSLSVAAKETEKSYTLL